MEDKEVSNEQESLEWFNALSGEDKQKVMEEAKRIILAKGRRKFDKLSFIFEGENPKIVGYEKGEEPKQQIYE